MTSISAAALTLTTAEGNGADTYLSNDAQAGDYGPDSLHGTEGSLAVRRYDGIRQKLLYVRFDLTGVEGDLSGATLSFNVISSSRTRTWGVYGLVDESLDTWDETTTCYSNAPGLLPAVLAYFAVDETKLRKLGTIDIVSAAAAYTSTISSLNLNAFLNGDTNKLVTFLVVPESTDSSAFWWVSSRESATPELAPALTLPRATERWLAAHRPYPARNATGVPCDAVLSWAPSGNAAGHDVYLGTDSQAVADGDAGVLVSPGRDANSYDPPGHLAFGQTYYWRVDEVNGAPDFGITRGRVWSFSVEPYSYPITGVTATASGYDANAGPWNTVNGSGLDATGLLHSTLGEDMWITDDDGPHWIMYSFNKMYKLDRMWIWNYNTAGDASVGAGCKDVRIEYSLNGIDWTVLSESTLFARAPSTEGYAHDTAIDFLGAAARHVRLTVLSNWGGASGQAGLSEVRFFCIPVYATAPMPASAAANVDPRTAVLSWRHGREAVSHELYLAADVNAVATGTVTPIILDGDRYGPASLLLASTYYWKVVEVNQAAAPGAWPGDVWSFSTLPFITVDDFESYTNDSPHRVFQIWTDGSGFSADGFFPDGGPRNGTGSVVGYDPLLGDIMETDIVHRGRQSMPLAYDNTADPKVSEARRTFVPAQDWSRYGITTLALWFRGDVNNVDAPIYVKINGVRVDYNDGVPGAASTEWRQWTIDLASLGVDLASIESLTLGVGDGSADATGTIFIDDILLYPTPVQAPADSAAGLSLHPHVPDFDLEGESSWRRDSRVWLQSA